MAATVLLDQLHSFQTTMGFQISTGFQLPTHGVPLKVPPVVIGPRAADQGSAFGKPAAARSVGWSGLLEISRMSAASGIMGHRTQADGADVSKDSKLEIVCTPHTNPAIRRLVKSVIRGLKACQEPEKALEGMGGTYFFLNDAGRKAAIIKPCDEEPLAPNNPKGYVGRQLGDPGWKPTVRVGEAAMREVAAYLLDYDHFARVPTSVLVRARHPVFCYNNRMGSVCRSSHDLGALFASNGGGGAVSPDLDALAAAGPPRFSALYAGCDDADASGADDSPSHLPMKLGSLQEFVQHECDTSEMGASRFAAADVHRIGILDLRLFNTDRHAGNMLVRVSRCPSSGNLAGLGAGAMLASGACKYELVPIDHGFCLPETLEAPYFEWLHWPQAMLPFSEEELAYIRNLDVQADKELLRKELPNLRPECLRVLEVATTVLQAGAAAGLTLYELASIMTRGVLAGGDEEPSQLEGMVAIARVIAETGDDDEDSDESTDLLEYDEEFEHHEHQVTGNSMEVSPSGAPADLGELLLFELEDDGKGLLRVRPTQASSSLPSAGGRSHMTYSGGSSVSSADQMMAYVSPFSIPTTPSAGAGFGSSAPRTLFPSRTPASGEVPFVPVARSLADEGHAWNQHQKQRRRVVAAAAGATKQRAMPQAYPPPVLVGAKSSGTGGVFTDLSESQWLTFMDSLHLQIHCGLQGGVWRAVSKDAAAAAGCFAAMSCPRF